MCRVYVCVRARACACVRVRVPQLILRFSVLLYDSRGRSALFTRWLTCQLQQSRTRPLKWGRLCPGLHAAVCGEEISREGGGGAPVVEGVVRSAITTCTD